MNKYTKICTIVFLITFTASSVFALSGMRLLTLENGGRPAGMGGAFTAVSSDPNSAAFNPAATYGLRGLNGTFSHNTHWQDVAVETGFISFVKKNVTVTTGVVVGHVEGLEGRSDSLPSSTYYPFDAQDASLKIGVSYKFHEKIILGAGFGWMYEKIDRYNGSAINFDIGAMYLHDDKLTVGASVQNFGSTVTIRDESYNLPTTLRLGGAYRYQKLLAALDIVAFDDSNIEEYNLRIHTGGEYEIYENLFLRAGYRFKYESKSFSAGFGYSKRNFRIDYAFLPYSNELDDSHIFSLTFNY